MRIGAQAVATASARFYAPLIMLFAATMLLHEPPGMGVGFVAGLAFSLALVLHMLVLGAEAARNAFPPWLARAALAIGLVISVIAVGVPGLAWAPRLVEAGAFTTTAAASALIVTALTGRAPAMRGGDAL